MGFEGGDFGLGVALFVALFLDDGRGGAIDEFLVAELLQHAVEEAFGVLQVFLQFLQLLVAVDVLAHGHEALQGAHHEGEGAGGLVADFGDGADVGHLAHDAVEAGEAVALVFGDEAQFEGFLGREVARVAYVAHTGDDLAGGVELVEHALVEEDALRHVLVHDAVVLGQKVRRSKSRRVFAFGLFCFLTLCLFDF